MVDPARRRTERTEAPDDPAEVLFVWVAALPISLLLGLAVGGGRWVRWAAFFLVVAAPCAYLLVTAEPYRRIGVFPEEVRRTVAFFGLSWVACTAGVAAAILVAPTLGLPPAVALLVALGGGLLAGLTGAKWNDPDRVRPFVLGSVAAQLLVVAVVGAPFSPLPTAAGWVGFALAPVGGGVATLLVRRE